MNPNYDRKLQLMLPKQSNLKARLKTDDKYFLDFIHSLLQIDPEDRPTTRDAMNHP